MKGIILSGGKGTRLHPLTTVVSKQLLPVYDKPMIYYPLSSLMLGGVKDIAIISTPRDIPQYKELLGNGENLGLNISYFVQSKPRGLADAFIVCEEFIGNDDVSLILGDNIFHGNLRLKEIFSNFDSGALVFGYHVNNPQLYGVIQFDDDGEITSILEKPESPPSNYIVPGFYIYDSQVVKFAKSLLPSERGELEITDLNNKYLKLKQLKVEIIGRGIAWLDVGRAITLQEAGQFICSVEEMQSYKIACIEEIAFREGFIDFSHFLRNVEMMPSSDYKDYLLNLATEFEAPNINKTKKVKDLQK